MKHQMRLNPEPFEAIKLGSQQIEARIFDEKRQQINVGDQILFLKRPDEKEQFLIRVIGISIFRSFEDLFQAMDKQKFGYYEEDTLEYQISCMRKYYSEEEEKEYGVIGIHLKKI